MENALQEKVDGFVTEVAGLKIALKGAVSQNTKPTATPCSGGQYRDARGACTTCPFGFYSVSGQTAGFCTACPNGTTTNPQELQESAGGAIKGQPSYHAVPQSGNMEVGIVSVCNWAQFVENVNGDSCPPGSQAEKPNGIFIGWCKLCAAGYYKTTTGQTISQICLPCPRDTFSEAGAIECLPCPAGTHNDMLYGYTAGGSRAGEKSCKYTASGLLTSGKCTTSKGQVTSERWNPCPAGSAHSSIKGMLGNSGRCSQTQQSISDTRYWQRFTSKSYTPLPWSVTYYPHRDPVGSIPHKLYTDGFCRHKGESNPTRYDCLITVGGDNQANVNCDIYSQAMYGQDCMLLTDYCTKFQRRDCAVCPSGQYATRGEYDCVDVCKSCPQGSYSSEPGQTQCTLCPTGATTDVKGGGVAALDCKYSAAKPPCPAGTFYLGNGLCGQCLPGTYNPSTATDAHALNPCLTCPDGMYTSEYGQTRCTSCPDGSDGTKGPGGRDLFDEVNDCAQ